MTENILNLFRGFTTHMYMLFSYQYMWILHTCGIHAHTSMYVYMPCVFIGYMCVYIYITAVYIKLYPVIISIYVYVCVCIYI